MERHWHRFYDHGVPHSIQYPGIPLKSLLTKDVENHPDKPFLIFKDLEFSNKVCNSMASKLAGGLSKLGVRKGDRVALMAPNISPVYRGNHRRLQGLCPHQFQSFGHGLPVRILV